MCGICGIINKESDNSVNAGDIKAMSDLLRHRGPDDDGFYINQQVGLGMRRLKVIDLATSSLSCLFCKFSQIRFTSARETQ